MLFRQLFDSESCTYTYLVADLATKAAVLVDPVLEQIERDHQLLQELNLTLRYCLETNIHADHVTSTSHMISNLVYPGHDYRGHTHSTIGEEKRWDLRFAGRDRDSFIELMQNLKLAHPKKRRRQFLPTTIVATYC